MSGNATRMPLADAVAIASDLVEAMRPSCERIEIAGSVRRRKATIGDIEIVAIPRFAADLLGQPRDSLLDLSLTRLRHDGRLSRTKGGAHFQQFVIPNAGCKLDLFTPSRATWGFVLFQRTGPAEWSHQAVTPYGQVASTGRPGLLPPGMSAFRARLWRDGKEVPTPEEIDVFRALGLKWLEPWERS